MDKERGGHSANENNIGRGNRRAPRRGNGRATNFSRGRTFYPRQRSDESYQMDEEDVSNDSAAQRNGQSQNRQTGRNFNFNKPFRSKGERTHNENWRWNSGSRNNFSQMKRGRNAQMSVHAKEFVPQGTTANYSANDFQNYSRGGEREASSSSSNNFRDEPGKSSESSGSRTELVAGVDSLSLLGKYEDAGAASKARRSNKVDESSAESKSRRSNKYDDYRQNSMSDNSRYGNYKPNSKPFIKNKGGDNSSSKQTNLYGKRGRDFSNTNSSSGKEDEATHRDRLIEQLSHNSCECTVCCDRVRAQDPVWSCSNCYAVFHLRCIRKWARSPAALVEGAGWRCPLCQQVTEKPPSQYYCFCGKMRDPTWNHYDTPHSCGQTCGRQRLQKGCVHRCTILCHPGPCPPCQVQVDRSCECGKTLQIMRCGQSNVVVCSQTCEKLLNCGVHTCQQKCHPGSCQPCAEKITQQCYCGKQSKDVLCNEETCGKEFFSCGGVCMRQLLCGNHSCSDICHPEPCNICPQLPSMVTHCPCGKNLLSDVCGSSQRLSCVDPVSSCGLVCGKRLLCGSEDNPHHCRAVCHTDLCPPCSLTTFIRCRCGSQTKEVNCAQLQSEKNFSCEKKCTKKRQCGRHKCLQKCCVDSLHHCELPCNRKLTCGQHNCDDLCHRGNCPPCWHTSFDELSCHCGASVIYPPISCGTKPPECNQPCARLHLCNHPITHSCHPDDSCPPCTYLTEKWCYGEHELRSNVPCYLTDVSCGRPCNKLLPCGLHQCPLTCHSGPCVKQGSKCTLPCGRLRVQCLHPCGLPCHGDDPCPESLCRAKVTVTCHCGHLSKVITCGENQRAIQQLTASAMAGKLFYLQPGQTVDISDSVKTNEPAKNKRLECNEDCALIDRNRRLALALQIRNPELTNKLGPPAYTDFLKDQMKQNARSVTHVYGKLSELVQSAKQSKQKSRSFAFPPMNRDQRRVIHELAEYFGCETQSYDEEPKKNVVVTALRDKSWLPSVSVMTVIERESVHRKAPPPIPHSKSHVASSRNDNAAEVQNSSSNSSLTNLQSNETKPLIDYFDYTPEP